MIGFRQWSTPDLLYNHAHQRHSILKHQWGGKPIRGTSLIQMDFVKSEHDGNNDDNDANGSDSGGGGDEKR